VAPGTFGTLAAIPLYWGLAIFLPAVGHHDPRGPALFLGVWACDVTGRDLGVSDHGAMVWDEIVAFLPLVRLVVSQLLLQALMFLLFRLFDIWKPFPSATWSATSRAASASWPTTSWPPATPMWFSSS
jgi:phosphatidylglycerophosphatase A